MKPIGAFCILFGAILWLLMHRREGAKRLATQREAIRFLEFTRDRIALCAMPLPDILSEYAISHSESLLCLDSPHGFLADYLSGAGESGTEGEIRRVDYYLSRLTDTLPAIEQEFLQQNRLFTLLSLSTALIVILILL